jgi:hypothetical protein
MRYRIEYADGKCCNFANSRKDLLDWLKLLKDEQIVDIRKIYKSGVTDEIEPLSRRYGMKVWQSYLENKTSGAMRMYWVYGPDQKDITIIGLEPHPEDKKNGAYDRISLSDL